MGNKSKIFLRSVFHIEDFKVAISIKPLLSSLLLIGVNTYVKYSVKYTNLEEDKQVPQNSMGLSLPRINIACHNVD